MSGSYFLVQRSKLLLITATAVTLGQGQGHPVHFPDPYILCAKYLRFIAHTVSTWEAKVVVAVDATAADAKQTENIKSPQTGVT